LGSHPDRLVRGDAQRATLVAVAHQPEEQVRLLSREGLETHLVDDHQARLHVLLALQTRRRHVSVLAHRVQQFFQPEERHRESRLHGADPKPNGQVSFSHARRTQDQKHLLVAKP
jgi:hypothetical protein